MQYYSSIKAKLIYIFTIDDAAHKGCVKIGEATLEEATDSTLQPNCKELNAAARKRIDQYTKTAGIAYTLRHTELTLSIHGGLVSSFNDKEVHNVLIRSGIQRHDFSQKSQGTEWFECSVETALKAIQAVKEGRSAISQSEIVDVQEVIEFRPEQQLAIDKTIKKFQSGGKVMLWNAKMRFGKTLTALQVVKEMRYHRTIIITHRPVVDKGWFEDFGKIFNFFDGYTYGSREKGEIFANLEKRAKKDPDSHYIYFASMQDLRGAEMAGGKFNKNAEIFKANYDLVIVDEAHEGTQTQLGQNVLTLLTKENTRVLNLSGTPFNLLEDYREDEIYTWDYVMEQKAKAEWDLNHFGDPNPYAGLPRLNIFTFDLGKAMAGFEDIEDSAFNFKEFFRTWTGDIERDHREMPEGCEGKFVHEEHVKSFLDLIVKYDETSNYPYSTVEYRNSFKHTLWMLPGVKEARALSALLQQHTIFGQFQIVNVAGDGDEDVPDDDALNLVEKAMGDDPEDTRTITLSCGKLTTGVSVKPWTAVMMLAGSHNTDAKAYMQTIFRVQTPYTTHDGKRKENCYVFDFAPDRTLKVLADTAKVSTKSTAKDSDRVKLGEFLNFCPVIGYNGTKLATYNVESMLEQLKKAYISRVTKNGCDDPRLYNQEMLRKLDAEALAKFQGLHKIIGATKANHTSTDVDMAKTGLTNEQYKELEKIKKKPKKELTEEDLRKIEEAKEKKKNADAAISILRGISIRLPLLMYGAELKDEGQDITLENFVELIDEQSWEEFMPRGITKELFKEFTPYYDPDMFRAVGRSYRDLVRQADNLAPMERVQAVSRIFSYFRNPDKETVLTPWRVVNMHIGDCIGGQVFYDEAMETEAVKPRYVDHGEVSEKVYKDKNTRILEINSKTGLYPLYMAYSVFAERLQEYRDTHMLPTDVPIQTQNEIWDKVLRDNIFVICKTEMAKSITKRTLRGFRKVKVNARYFEDLINKITNQPQLFLQKVVRGQQYWSNNDIEDNMKFSAIVGNPPYQLTKVGTSDDPIYHLFMDISYRLCDLVTFITPARFLFNAGKTPKEWNQKVLNDPHFKVVWYKADSTDVFPNVDIKGGVAVTLRDASQNFGKIGVFTSHSELSSIIAKVLHSDFKSIKDLVYAPESYRLSSVLHRDHPEVKPLLGDGHQFDVTTNIFDKIPMIFSETKPVDGEEYIQIYGRYNNMRVKQWIRRRYVDRHPNLDCYKVFVAKSNGSGVLGEALSSPALGEPGVGHTQTFISLGAFRTAEEASACLKYLQTKFARIMLGTLKVTQDNKKETWQNVPIQDFSRSSDINWDCSVSMIDQQLYNKYGFTNEEVLFIENTAKAMIPLDEKLFEVEETIDQDYGAFNLEECGVKPGDRITYTPTGQELTVLEDNRLEYEGEAYSIADFTYKNMPQNSISKSGVCKGPKYFSYNGVSLYKLKDSFLGGKK